MSAETDVAIVGAGPYGLSIAAHLRARGVDHRIVGNPMQFWRAHMPVGMLLKSDGFASDIFDPEGRFPLARYCEGEGISYADIGIPVRVETFTAYGMAFQQRYAPALENKTLVALRTSPTGFELRLQNGELLTARRVVLAIGIKDFSQVPEELAHLPPEFLSHSSEHSHLGRFSGREVTVIGSGASAVDLAVLLHESGAMVQLLARKLSIKFHNKMELPRPLWDRVRSPVTGIGPGWRYVAFSEAPLAVHYLPGAVRHAIVRRVLGPSAGWFVRDRFADVPRLLGCRLKRAEILDNRVQLHVVLEDGDERRLTTEHVIAATGYRANLGRLGFLSEELRSQLRSTDGAPVLSSHFESSVPGLYFVGAVSAYGFGPVMRFAVGAKFTARRLSQHLTAARHRTSQSKTIAGPGRSLWHSRISN